MFFSLSKLADLGLAPLTWALFLCAAAPVLALRRRPRAAAACGALSLLVLLVFSASPVSNALLRAVEQDAPRTAMLAPAYDAAILLGGLVDAEASESNGQTDYTDAVERLLTAYDLLRTGRVRAVLISGGAADPRIREAFEARLLGKQLQDWGIAPARIVLEDQSRNTRENAANSAKLVRERDWHSLLLITSAFHMWRAAGTFRAAGLDFDTLPVDYRSHDPVRFAGSWLPRADSLSVSTVALRELAGRAVYRAFGYSTR